MCSRFVILDSIFMNFSVFTTKSTDEVLKEIHTTSTGLTSSQVVQNEKQFGSNELSGKESHWYGVLIRQFKSPFLYLLIAAALLSLLLRETLDGLMILLFVSINTTLGFLQEYRSEKTLKLLKQFAAPTTKVYRDGKEETVQSSHLVPGDIVILQPGDIIPADLRFFKTEQLTIDESILTGESVAIVKTSDPLPKAEEEIYKANNIGFSGTTVVSGEGLGVVINIGHDTAIGDIATLTTETKHTSIFQKGINSLSSFILKLILITLVVILLVNIFLKGPHADVVNLVIFAIALAISVIPEALPVVTTFSLSSGALRLAKNKVVVKRLASIEDLGSIEVLCTDKTGTITENKLSVSELFPKDSNANFFGSLATSLVSDTSPTADAFDTALLASLSQTDQKKRESYKRLDEIPFDPKRRRNSVLVKAGDTYTFIVRGAAENVLPLCKKTTLVTDQTTHEWIKNQGKEGKRVIALAKKTVAQQASKKLPDQEKDLELIGFISFADPLKKTAHKAIAQAKMLGVQVKILTGDSKDVAGAIAWEIGLIPSPDQVMTGDELDALPVTEQSKKVKEFNVFARVTPLQKHKIVQLLQQTLEVGFLGEGINDAPALKAANVAIVVQGASGIAREASDIVLLNKSLHVVIDGIREGRLIFANTAKYIKATLSSNFGNFYTVAIASLFIPFLPLLPLQILLINLLTDFPMIAVVTDNVDPQELKRPRNYDIKELALFATIMGVLSSFFDFLFFVFFYKISPGVLQTNWFIGSVLTELVFLFAIRSRLPIWKASLPSFPLVALSAVAFVIAIVLPFTAFGQDVFQFIKPPFNYLSISLILTACYFVATELVKNIYYKFIKNSSY